MSDEERVPPGRWRPPPGEDASWVRLRAVFLAALEIPGPERRAWMAAHADLDEGFRAEVLSLLEAHERAGGFLDPADTRWAGWLADRMDQSGGRST
jgi:hypothetical protein